MNSSRVYRVFTSVGVGTTFRLPAGWKITDFVVTDPGSFHAESNGTNGIATPLATHKATSAIFTGNDRLFVFSLSSEPFFTKAVHAPTLLVRPFCQTLRESCSSYVWVATVSAFHWP